VGWDWVHLVRGPLTGLLYQPRMWSSRWNENWQGKPKYSEKTCPSTTLSTTDPTSSELGSNPGRRGEKPATNRLSYGAAFAPLHKPHIYISSTRVVRGRPNCLYSTECRHILARMMGNEAIWKYSYIASQTVPPSTMQLIFFFSFSLSQHVSAVWDHHQAFFCQKNSSLCGISHFFYHMWMQYFVI
jgi:hypothetical protein